MIFAESPQIHVGGGLPCKLEGIVESSLVNGYRDKCEFSVGYSVQGKPTAGFILGNFREGVTAVEEPTNCQNVSTLHFDDELGNSEFERMAQAFAVGPSADSPLPLTSLVVQIYNEQSGELIDPTQRNLEIRDDTKHGFYVENLTEEYVTCYEDITQILIKARS